MTSRKRRKAKASTHKKCLSFECLEVRRLLASDWQNPGQALDVNHDLTLGPIDALLGINRLNSRVPRLLPPRAPGSSDPYFDTNGDGSLAPVDVIAIINALNRGLPTVAIELERDTGSGTGASSDLRTSDLSIQGKVSGRVKATELWGRFNGDPQWHKLKTFLPTDTNQNFSIPHDELIAALGTPDDGLVTLEFQPRFGATNASIGIEADLPVIFDRRPPQFNFENQPNFLGAISMPLPSTIEIPLNERASTSTLVASKVQLFNASFSSFQTPVELTPRSLSISSDGRFLLIDPPTTSQSITYSVSVQEGAFEDLAGNLNVAFRAVAHHFSDASQTPLAFGQKIDFSSTQTSLREYTFELTSPDLFILAGLEASNAMQLDLFSPSGRRVRNWATEAEGGSLQSDSANRAMLTELGEYTLRVAASPSTSVSFKALLAKQVNSVPPNSQLQGTFTWAESQALAVSVTNQDRIYFQNNLNPQTPFRVTLLDEYGQELTHTDLLGGDRVFTVPSAGRYIALIEASTAVRPLAYDFSMHLSQTVKQPLTFGQFQQNTLTTPGQQVFYTFAARAARTYTLEIESAQGDVTLVMPGVFEVNQQGDFPIEESGEGYVLSALNQAGLPSALTRFRVVESVTTVAPPLAATIRTEPLQQGITQKTIQLEQERYEFTFTATAGELYAFGQNGLSGIGVFDLVAPTGATIDAVEQSEGFRVYRIPYAGEYRLRAFGDVSDELVFQWQKLSTATALTANAVVNGNFPDEFFAAYRFAANNTRFFVFPTAVADGLIWKLIDENGKVVVESDFNLELAANVVTGRSYTLVVEKQSPFASTEFDFRRRNTVNGTRTVALGNTATGNLPARGDRVVIELSLVAGQLIDLTSNLDPGLASVRWLDYFIDDSDIPRDIDPDVPTFIGSTRKYRVEIQNSTDAAVAYSVKFDAIQKPLTPPSTLVGFDQIRSGTVENAPQTFTFNVSAGAYYMFDWLLEEDPDLQIEIIDPSGNNVNSVPTGADSSLAVVEADGLLTVEIANFSATSRPFSFRMISPSTGELVSLGTKKSATVIPYGTTFFRVNLPSTTEVFLQTPAASDSTSLFRLGSSFSSQVFEGPFISGQFLVGDAFVWASNVDPEPYSTEFTAINVSTLNEVPLNSPVIVQTVPGATNLVPFKTTAANTIIGASGFAVLDQSGAALEPILQGSAYLLKQPGDYRAVFLASNATTQIEIHTQVEANATATLASPISGTIEKIGDVNRYSLALTAGAPILLSLEVDGGGFAQWVTPNGEVFAAFRNGSTVLPVFLTGTYQLELYSATNATNFKFELNDLSQATTIAAGLHSGNTGAGLIKINRLVANPNQLFQLEGSLSQDVQLTAIDRLGNPLPQVSFANRLFNQAPADGVIYILVQSLPGKSAVAFNYSLDLVSSVSQTATLGQPINGTLNSRLEGRTYTFNVSQPTWLRVANTSSDSSILVLRMADGSLRSSPEGFFGLVLAGNYEVGIYNDARSTNTFSMTIDLLSQSPSIPLNQVTTINKAGRYRLDIGVAGRFELQLQNNNGTPLEVSELSIANLNGSEIDFDPRGFLDAGSYWVTVRSASSLPPGDYKLNVASITTTESVLAVDALGEYSLNANGLQEHLVTLQLKPGMRLLIDELELGTGGRVEVRFNGDVDGDWMSIDQLPSIVFGTTGKETLQFRIAGTGLVRLHVLDINVAAQLALGSITNLDLNSRRRGQAWTIGGNVGDILDIINDLATERPALWMIVDEAGNIITAAINEPINLAIVNRQRLALVVFATEPLSTSVSVPFRTVIS